jgi:hypothetical protein
MKYFIFDMDETLAELYSVYYFVASLRLNEMYKDEDIKIPDHLKKSLDKAYKIFVNNVLKKEISNKPLGVLRPGILDVMFKLNELKRKEKIGHVIIYSNNGHLESLEFIRDIIHRYLDTNDLIIECVHWNHHMREEERKMEAGVANKTWNVLRNILVNGKCMASENIEPKDVYFFDDLFHKDLIKNLEGNYYKVPPYNFKASFDRLSDIYMNSLRMANVDTNIFSKYIVEAFTNNKINNSLQISYVVTLFKQKTKGTADIDTKVPEIDDGIGMMLQAINNVSMIGGKKRKIIVIETRRRKYNLYRKKRGTRRKIETA